MANVPEKAIAVVADELQIAWLAGTFAKGVGLTEMRKVSGVPTHPLAEGVTIMDALIGALVLFVAVNNGISPEPFAARPMAVLVFVQVKTVPLTVPVR